MNSFKGNEFPILYARHNDQIMKPLQLAKYLQHNPSRLHLVPTVKLYLFLTNLYLRLYTRLYCQYFFFNSRKAANHIINATGLFQSTIGQNILPID